MQFKTWFYLNEETVLSLVQELKKIKIDLDRVRSPRLAAILQNLGPDPNRNRAVMVQYDGFPAGSPEKTILDRVTSILGRIDLGSMDGRIVLGTLHKIGQ